MTDAMRKFPLSFTRLAADCLAQHEAALTERVEDRLTASERARRAGGDDEELRRGGGFGAPEHRRRGVKLAGRTMRLGQPLGERDGDRAHRDVDRLLAERAEDAAVTKDDRLDGAVVGEHGDDELAGAGARRAVGDEGAFALQRLGAAARAVVDGDAMPGLEKVAGHRLPHVTESDKA